MESVPFSELLRRPIETTERLTRGRALRLRRHDAVYLVLMSADRADAEGEVVDLTARLLAGIAHRDPALMREVLLAALPWARFLPDGDADTMMDEFIATAQAATSADNLAPMSQLLIEWRHTAEVHAHPDLYRALSSATMSDFGVVPRPGE